MIAEAAYYLAQKRQFLGEHALDDWLAAEQQVRLMIAPPPGRISVDDIIDGVAREALDEARRKEQAEKYRNKPNPVAPAR